MSLQISSANKSTAGNTTTITVKGTAPPNTALTASVVNIQGSETSTTSDVNGNFTVPVTITTPNPGGDYSVRVQIAPNGKYINKAVSLGNVFA
jgi:hypothetical protein